MKNILFFALCLIISLFTSQCDPISPEQIQKIANEKRLRDSIENISANAKSDSIRLSKLEEEVSEVEAFVSSFDMNNHKEKDGSHYIVLCTEINGYALLAQRLAEDSTTAIRGKTLLKKLKSLSIANMPAIRKQWATSVDRAMWENNIDVKCFGAGNRTLEFVGGTFASNANIKDFQTTLSDGLHTLRFKRVNYRWYDGADEYQYYTIESKQDGVFD